MITPKKCKFMFKQITFLGYDISESEIRPEHDKLDHLRNVTPPETPNKILPRFYQLLSMALYNC